VLIAPSSVTLPARAEILAHGLRFQVAANDIDPITWARGYFLADAEGPLHGSRRIEQDVADVTELIEHLRAAGRPPVVRKTFKDVLHEHYTLSSGSGELQAFVPSHQDYVLVRQGDEIAIRMSPTSREPGRHLLRIMREITFRTLESAGGVALHAATVSQGDEGFLLVGASGAGKTTLLVAFLLAGGGFVCNDRAMLVPHARRALGLPLPVRLGAGTLLHVPALRRHLSSRGALSRAQSMTFPEAQSAGSLSAADWGSPKKIELSPAELCELLGASAQMSAPLGAIIAPVIHRDPCAPRLERLSADEAQELLLAERCTPDDPLWPDPWIEPRDLPGDARDLLRKASEETPAFRLHFGVDWPEALVPWLERGGVGL
jgi:hypothetical protein